MSRRPKALHWIALLLLLGLSVWLIWGSGKDARSVALGVVLTALAGLAAWMFTRGEAIASATYLEKLKAYQDVVQRILVAEDAVVRLWLAMGERKDVERALIDFQNCAFYHKVWIGDDGVEAMRCARDGLRNVLDESEPDETSENLTERMKSIQRTFEEKLAKTIGGLPT